MIPDYPQFSFIELSDIHDIAPAVTALNAEESELAPACFFIWQDSEQPYLTRIHGNICILIRCEGEEFFLRPLGDRRLADTLNVCLDHCGRLDRLSEAAVQELGLDPERISPTTDQFDYLYLRLDLAEMKGGRYDGKRNHIKRFQKLFPQWRYQPLNAACRTQALQLFDDWSKAKNGAVAERPADESAQRKALNRAFSAFAELNLSGGAVWDGERMLGFILGSPLKADTVDVHFQYGLPEARGVMPLLLQEAARSSFSAWDFLNLEQDVGLPGLRKSKLSLHPLRLIRKFAVNRPRTGGPTQIGSATL